MHRLIAVGVTAVSLVFGMLAADAKAEGAPNWLADVIKDARSKHRGHGAQAEQIKESIKKNPKGKALVGSGKLDEAIKAGLIEADKVENGPKEPKASPAVAASWKIFEICNVPVPESDGK